MQSTSSHSNWSFWYFSNFASLFSLWINLLLLVLPIWDLCRFEPLLIAFIWHCSQKSKLLQPSIPPYYISTRLEVTSVRSHQWKGKTSSKFLKEPVHWVNYHSIFLILFRSSILWTIYIRSYWSVGENSWTWCGQADQCWRSSSASLFGSVRWP